MIIPNHDEKRISPIFLLFLFYILIWWLQLGERIGNRFGHDIRLEAAVALVLLICLPFHLSKFNPEEKAGFTPFIIALFFVMILQVVFAWNTERAWYIFTERVLKYSAMALFISIYVKTPFQMKLFILTWLFACWKGTSEGVIGGISGSLIWENQGIPRLHGNGLWSHPNSFSQFALGAMPYCYYLYPIIKKKWQKIGIISLFLFSAYVVIYTGSRTGYLGFLIMMGLFYFQSNKKVRKSLIFMALILAPIMIVSMPNDYKERFKSSFSGHEKEGASKEARLKLYREGWFVFTNHPFGVGVGNYPEAGMKYFGYKQEQHCLYTEVLTELGIQGFIVFMVLIWKINKVLKIAKAKIKTIINSANKPDKSGNLQFLFAILQATQLYFLLRLFLDIFGMDLYGITWWFTIGIASSMTYILYGLRYSINKPNEKVSTHRTNELQNV